MNTTLTLPSPPTSNHAYATVTTRSGTRRIKSTNPRNTTMLARIFTQRIHPRPIFAATDRIAVTLVLHPPDGRRFDIANREKILIDAIAPVLGFNDNQIDIITIERRPPDGIGTVIAAIATYHPNTN